MYLLSILICYHLGHFSGNNGNDFPVSASQMRIWKRCWEDSSVYFQKQGPGFEMYIIWIYDADVLKPQWIKPNIFTWLDATKDKGDNVVWYGDLVGLNL